jgi:hypothetical protein
MNALDVSSRGLAQLALQLGPKLAGPQGAFSIGRQRSEPEALLEPIKDILDRIDLSPQSFGALCTGETSDEEAFWWFNQAISMAGEGIVRLDPKTYTFGLENPDEGFRWKWSNGGLIGRGVDRTILRNIHPQGMRSLELFESCENVYFADLTFDGRMLCWGANSLRNVIFHRCRFTTAPTQAMNAVQIVTDNMAEGVRFVYFIDCEFVDAGRMNLELQNHTNDGVIRYANIYLIRPRIIGAGKVDAVNGFGLSFSGKGERVVIDRPYFDGNSATQLENAGCDRMVVRDAEVRASTLPVGQRPIVFSAVDATYDSNENCVIDGFTLVRAAGDMIGARPAMSSTLYFEASRNLVLRRIVAAIDNTDPSSSEASVIFITSAGPDSNGTPRTSVNATIEDCDLWSNAPGKSLIEFIDAQGVQYVTRNQLHNDSADRFGALVAANAYPDAQAFTVRLANNRMSAARPHSQTSFLTRSGPGGFTVEDNNDGLPVRFRQTVTVPAGATQSAPTAHGLPAETPRLLARSLGPTFGAGACWTTAQDGYLIANFTSAPSADVSVEVEAEAAY